MKIRIKYLSILIALVSVFTIEAKAQQAANTPLKTNIAPINNALNYVTRLRPVSFEYHPDHKEQKLPAGIQFGFIATEARQVVPFAITAGNNWYSAGKNTVRATTTSEVDMHKLIPLLVGAIKEQQAEIDSLKQDLQQLKQTR